MDTALLASMARLTACIAANDALGDTKGGEQLEEFAAEYDKILTRTRPDQ
jgi:hypothetical protein